MNKKLASSIAFALLGAASVATAAPPAGPWGGCAFQNLSFDFSKLEMLETPLPGYDGCAVIPVTGTLKGRLISCFRNADFKPSAEVFDEDDDYRFWVGKWYDVFETRDGKIFGEERGWLDFDPPYLQASIYTITGGEGRFEGVTGLLTFSPAWSKAGAAGLGRGYICPAD